MNFFIPVVTQMAVLFAFVAIGFLLVKFKVLSGAAAKTLSKLESFVFVPALVMGTFIKNCTVENIGTLWKVLLFSFAMLAVCIALGFLFVKLCCKKGDTANAALYGLVFSNFGFVGNAVVKGVFPDMFFMYTVFTLPFWFAIYAWGVPTLLIADEKQTTFKSRLKNFINPMLIAMIIGVAIGLSGLKLPEPMIGAVDTLGDCMSPLAMILMGVVIGSNDIKAMLKNREVYIVSAIRLIVFPLLFILAAFFIAKGTFFSREILVCGTCMAAMPMGLNTIVIPAAYGKDVTYATALTVVTQICSLITIPLLFLLFGAVI